MNNTMYKIISIDLDGTLLTSNKTISTETVDTLKKLSNAGYIIVISTGRSIVGIPSEIINMNCIDYFITSNGASCVDKNGKYLIKNWINYKDVEECISDRTFFVEYLISGKWYITKEDIKQIKNVIEDKKIVDYILNTRNIINNSLNDMDIEKINLNFSQDNYNYALNKINSMLENNKNIRVWTDKKHKLDIYSTYATKGNALKQLAESIDIDSSQIIAFGDDDNDLEMLDYVGCAVAMKNGNDNVKNKAKYITEFDNDNNGIAEFIKKYILI